MKYSYLTLFILLTCLLSQFATAQQIEGVITYEVKMNMHRRLPKEREAMKAMIPEFRVTKQQLFFNANESLYKRLEEDEDEAMGNGEMRVQIRTPKNEIYTNVSSEKKVEQREFLGKNYIITDTLKVLPWKLEQETKTILGYSCKKAAYTDAKTKQSVTAWYTDKIRSFLGPESYNSLPGAVLEIDINEGERVFKALKVEPRALKKGELAVPGKGQAVTEAEFRKQMEEHLQKMNAGGGNMIIRNY